MSPPKLSRQENIAAKRAARGIIGTPAPNWSEYGHDKKMDMLQQLIGSLRGSENIGIAEKIEQNNALGWRVFGEKCKSMRAEERKLASMQGSLIFLLGLQLIC